MKPYKINKLIFDPKSMVIRVITTNKEEYVYPILPAPERQKERVRTRYDTRRGIWIIEAKEYDSIRKGNYDTNTILDFLHEPTHYEIRVICPWYSGFKFLYGKYDMQYIESIIPNLPDEEWMELITTCFLIQQSVGVRFTNFIEDILSAHVLATAEKFVVANDGLRPVKIADPIEILQRLPTFKVLYQIMKTLVNEKGKVMEYYIAIREDFKRWFERVSNIFNRFAKMLGVDVLKDSILAVSDPETFSMILVENIFNDKKFFRDIEYRISGLYYISHVADSCAKLNPEKLIHVLEVEGSKVYDPFMKLRYDLEYIRLRLDDGIHKVLKSNENVEVVVPAIEPYNIKKIVTKYLKILKSQDVPIKFKCKRSRNSYLVEIF